MQERVFFDAGGVKVTNARFIVPGQTFAVSNITAVKWSKVAPGHGAASAAIILGILGALFSLALGAILAVISVALVGLGIWLWRRELPTAQVVLVTAAGEVSALAGTIEFIGQVTAAQNQAIVEGK